MVCISHHADFFFFVNIFTPFPFKMADPHTTKKSGACVWCKSATGTTSVGNWVSYDLNFGWDKRHLRRLSRYVVKGGTRLGPNSNHTPQSSPFRMSTDTDILFDISGLLKVPEGKCQYYGLDDESSAPPSVPTSLSCNEYLDKLADNNVLKVKQTCDRTDLVFDKSVVLTTLVQKYGFTCESEYLKQIYGALYMLGMLFGSFIVGAISDRYGRMKALMLGVILVSASGFFGAFMPTEHGFGLFRFITGIGGICMYQLLLFLATSSSWWIVSHGI
jgi:hypothetical protein